MIRLACVLVAAFTSMLAGTSTAATACNASSPTVEGPVEGGRGFPYGTNFFDLAPYGYMEEEYFIAGTARMYPPGEPDAQYKTRLLVWRPIDPADFNGTVLIEWENVTGQAPGQPTWYSAHPFALREGYAWVAVSAQRAGQCCAPTSLRIEDPVRYASLMHPGDQYSFDIFSQTAQMVGCPQPGAIDPMGSLRGHIERIIGGGASQSAGRLVSYLNLVRDVRVYDGILIQQSLGDKEFPADLDIPTIQLESEEGFNPPDATAPLSSHRLWELAGADHFSSWFTATLPYLFIAGFGGPKLTYEEHQQYQDEAGEYGEDRDRPRASCATAGAFPLRYGLNAAIYHLNKWLEDPNHVPPVAPRALYEADGTISRDGFGNARGGVRLPPVEVPVATYTGDACFLFGVTEPFCDAQLAALYPSHEVYVNLMQAATDAAVAAGFLLPVDAADLMLRATRSTIGTQSPDICAEADSDSDGRPNSADNCPFHSNPSQENGDGDGRGDACDNCVYISNPGQEDDGGIATSQRDGIGNACQCGDVTGDGIVNGRDGVFMTRHGLGYDDPTFAAPGNCDVTGNGLCNGQDGFFTTRAGLGFSDPLHVAPQGQNCPNATGGGKS